VLNDDLPLLYNGLEKKKKEILPIEQGINLMVWGRVCFMISVMVNQQQEKEVTKILEKSSNIHCVFSKLCVL